MSETIQGALIGAGSALLGALLTMLVGIWRDSRNAEKERIERRFDARRTACAALLAEADRIDRLAADRLWEFETQGGPPMPADEGGPLDPRWGTLWDALAQVELVASHSCSMRGMLLVTAVEQFAWTGGDRDIVGGRREQFIEAARHDLNITPAG